MKKSPILLKIGLYFAAAVLMFSIAMGVVAIVRYNGERKDNSAAGIPTPTPTPIITSSENAPTPIPTATPVPTQKIRVCLDAGNPPITSTNYGKLASEWTKEMVDRITYTLNERGYDVYVTDINAGLNDKALYPASVNADLFISIQVDSYSDEKAEGVYCINRKPGTEGVSEENINNGKTLGAIIKSKVIEYCGAASHSDTDKGQIVINSADIPAVMLELGYMSNTAEDANLWKPDYQKKMSDAICDGIDEYLRQKPVNR